MKKSLLLLYLLVVSMKKPMKDLKTRNKYLLGRTTFYLSMFRRGKIFVPLYYIIV
jgi:hypothetical protein